MNTPILHTLYRNHSGKVSDKWGIYLDVYQRLFQPYTNLPISLLEIGIQNGGSLEIWAQHFPVAQHFVGCDIDLTCAGLRYDDPRIVVVVGDANTDGVEQQIAEHAVGFDIVIDDGSHVSKDIVQSFIRYFKRIKDGGIFLAEDLHCSYWKEFDGGLFDPYSSIAFFKRLADVINHEHWGVPGTRGDILRSFFAEYACTVAEDVLASIHSIEFFNSICVVRKERSVSNELGLRILAGTATLVSAEGLALPTGKALPPTQSGNAWSNIQELPERHLERLARQGDEQVEMLEKLRRELADLTANHAKVACKLAAITASHAQLAHELQTSQCELNSVRMELQAATSVAAAMITSRSWRITAPLRYLRRFFG